MTEQPSPQQLAVTKVKQIHKHSDCNIFYGLGFIGPVIYYIMAATSFWGGVLGVLKAIDWPALLIFELL